MIFSLSLSMLTILLLATSGILAVGIVIWYFRRYNIVASAMSQELPETTDLPPVSIIVYTCNDAANLRNTIPLLMSQDYPQYEVIVVDDSPTDTSKDLLLEMSLAYNNLYSTFIPNGTLNLSRKKLAITLGMKAAKYDIVLTTCSNCVPLGNDWLWSIASRFVPGIDVVLGYSHADPASDTGFGKFFRRYDTAVDATQYLSYAIKGKIYRGDSNNMAYRKALFFENKGFSQSLNLHFGEDDLFVSEIANAENTCVVLSPESQLTTIDDSVADTHKELKLRHDFTSQYLKTWAKRSSSYISAFQYLFVALNVVVIILSPLNLFPILLAAILLIFVATIQITMYRKVCKVLNTGKLLLSIPLFSLIRPLVNMRYKILGRHYRKLNYTWQRLKR